MRRLDAFGARPERMYQSRVCYTSLLRIMYLPGSVSPNRPVEGQLDLRLWVIRDNNSALFPFKMLLLKLFMSLINSNG